MLLSFFFFRFLIFILIYLLLFLFALRGLQRLDAGEKSAIRLCFCFGTSFKNFKGNESKIGENVVILSLVTNLCNITILVVIKIAS